MRHTSQLTNDLALVPALGKHVSISEATENSWYGGGGAVLGIRMRPARSHSLLKTISLKAHQQVSAGHPSHGSVGPMLVFLHPGPQGAAAFS